jgi:hypothetical protein
VKLTTDRDSTSQRKRKLDEYFAASVGSTDFVCPHYDQCKASNTGFFYEGQLHHVGRFYDLFVDDLPFRVIVVGQEYGGPPSRVNATARYDMLMRSGLEQRFKAEQGYKARNPHMRGTTNVLRLLFGLPLGNDYESEFLTVGAERVHLFHAFGLVNYLLCSAVGTNGSTRGLATPDMMKNCQRHFREALRILEPSVVVVQGKGFWKWVKGAFDSVAQMTEHTYKATLGLAHTHVGVFTHPCAHFPNNWGTNSQTPYLLGTVAPSIAYIRNQLLRTSVSQLAEVQP